MAFCTNCGSPVEGAFCTKCGAKVEAQGGAVPPPPPSAPPPQVPHAASPVSIPPPPAQAPKKGRFIFWILGGCLALIVIAVIVIFSTCTFFAKKTGFDIGLMQKDPGLAVAKMIATTNPNIEILSVDEDKGIIRVRDKETGKTLTMDLKEAKNGKVVFLGDDNQRVEIQSQGEGDRATLDIQSSEGSMRIGANAGKLPGWLPAYPGAKAGGGADFYSEQGDAGSSTFLSNDSAQAVAAFYENALRSAGFQIEKTSNQIPGQGPMTILSAVDDANQRKANITVMPGTEGTSINLTFEGK